MKRLVFATAVLILAAGAARAADVDVTKVLRAPNGQTLTDCDKFVDDNPQKGCEPGKTVVFTMGRALVATINKTEFDARGQPVELKLSEMTRRGHLIDKIVAVAFPVVPLSKDAPRVVSLEPWEQDLIEEKLPKSGLPPYTATQIDDALHPPVTQDEIKKKAK